jgi:hypothetical protein
MSQPSPEQAPQVPVVDVGARVDEILRELATAGFEVEGEDGRYDDGRL